MGTTADKLAYLNGTKTAIKNAIVAKGVEVPDGTTFRQYAEKIGEISGGGGGAWDDALVQAIKQNSDLVVLNQPYEEIQVSGDADGSYLINGYYAVLLETIQDSKKIIFLYPSFSLFDDNMYSPPNSDTYLFDSYAGNISLFRWANLGYRFGFQLIPYSGRPCNMYVPRESRIIYH